MISGIGKTLLCIALACLIHCGNLAPLAGGGVSETTNGFALGIIFNQDGSPAANSRVMLVPQHHDPVIDSAIPLSMTDTTDAQGRYQLKSRIDGLYNIQGINDQSGDRLLISAISIRKNDTTITGGTFHKPGAIKIILPDYFDRHYGYLYLQGTTFPARIEKDYAIIDSVPAGTIPSLNYGNTAYPQHNRTIKTHIAVSSRDTTVIADYAAWQFSKRLQLNTTVSGADVSGDVFNIPVLVRLTAGNFAFGQAKESGEDLRFAKADSAPLPYEIERWDPVTELAEAWVTIDTVHGNDSTQSIIMFWGNTQAQAGSNGMMVFDTAHSAAGVWHLNKTCNDATFNSRHGSPSGTTDTVGVIGYCQRFNGTAFVKIPGLLGTQPMLTLSAWVLLDTVRLTGAEVVSIGDAALIRMDDSWNGKGTLGSYCVNPAGGVDSTHCFAKSGLFLKKTGWRHVSYSIDPVKGIERFYIDGSLCSSTESVVPIVYNEIGSDTYLGRHGNGKMDFNFSGCIDEVRVCRTVRSADWIKLSYMNQRPDDRLVVFK
jgi:hypothetical protein